MKRRRGRGRETQCGWLLWTGECEGRAGKKRYTNRRRREKAGYPKSDYPTKAGFSPTNEAVDGQNKQKRPGIVIGGKDERGSGRSVLIPWRRHPMLL